MLFKTKLFNDDEMFNGQPYEQFLETIHVTSPDDIIHSDIRGMGRSFLATLLWEGFHKKKYTIDHTLINSPITNYVVRVLIKDTSNMNSNGHDVRFISDNGLPLVFERVYHIHNYAEYHVKIPYVSDIHDTIFYMLHSAEPHIDVSGQPWSTNYKLVYHMSGDAVYPDSSPSNNHGISFEISPTPLVGWSHAQHIAITGFEPNVQLDLDLTDILAFEFANVDGSDIRITDNNNNLLPFWLESFDKVGKTGKLIFKTPVDTIPHGILHIGNPTATSVSDGDATFEFFDDFIGTNIDTTKWNIVDGTGWSVGKGELQGSNTSGRLLSHSLFSSGIILEIKANAMMEVPFGYTIGGFWKSIIDGITLLQQSNTIHSVFEHIRNDTIWHHIDNIIPEGIDILQQFVVQPTTVNLKIVRLDTNAVTYNALHTNSVINEHIMIGMRADDHPWGENQTYETYWDWIRVRKVTTATALLKGVIQRKKTNLGYSQFFANTLAYIDIPHHTTLNNISTIEIVIQEHPIHVPTEQFLIEKPGEYLIRQLADIETIGVRGSVWTTVRNDVNVPGHIAEDVLHTFTLRIEPTTISIFHNGILIDTTPITGSIATTLNNLEIGKLWDGCIYSVRMTTDILSDAQIFAEYHNMLNTLLK